MRIIGIHIENFGRLSNCDLTFDTGLNTVIRENGWGKTSLAAFIRAMFYGLEGERKHDLKENERLRYQPWNKGHFGGSMKFEAGGRCYIVTRDFGEKDRNEGFRLQDAETLLDSTDYSERLGEELFHIDREAFGRTAFLNHASVLYNGGGSLPGDSEGTEAGAEDLNRYGIADEQLKNYLNENSPTRKTGRIYKQKEEIRTSEQELKRLAPLKERIEGLLSERTKEEEQLKSVDGELSRIRAEQKTLAAFRTEAVLHKQREQQKGYLQQCLKKVRMTEEEFGGTVPSADDVRRAKEDAERILRLESILKEDTENARYLELSGFFRNGIPDGEEIIEQIRLTNEVQNILRDEELMREQLLDAREQEQTLAEQAEEWQQKKHIFGIWPVLSVLFFAGGAFLAAALLFHKIPKKLYDSAFFGCVLLIFAFIFSLLQIIRRRKNYEESGRAIEERAEEGRIRAEKTEKRLNELMESAEAKKTEVADFLKRWELSPKDGEEEALLYDVKSRAEQFRSLSEEEAVRVRKREEKLSEKREAEVTLRERLAVMGAPGGLSGPESILDYLGETGERLNRLSHEKENAAAAELQLSAFNAEHPEEPGKILFSEEQIAGREKDLNSEEAAAAEKEKQMRESLSARSRELFDAYSEQDSLEETADRLSALKEEEALAQEQYLIVKKTREYISMAKDRFTARFMEPIKTAFDRYYALLSGRENGGEEFRIDAGLRIERKEEGAFHAAEAQSDGYSDMIGLCIRMAILDVKFTREKPPVIMDDPLVYLDEGHLEGAKEFLRKISEDYQVIYMTCHGDRA